MEQNTTVILPIASVVMGERLREEYGDMDALMASLATWGQCVPILVDQSYTLCDGGRRYRAIQQLGWPTIIATVREMTEDERVALELELDDKHKPLTAYERSKGIIQRAQEWSDGAKTNSSNVEELRPGPKSPYVAPKDDVAKAIGVGTGTLVRAEQHVAAVEEFPDLADKPQDRALSEARKRRQTDDDKARAEQWKKHDIVHTTMGRLNVLRQIDAEAYVARLGGLTALTVFLENDLEIAEASVEWLRAYAAALRMRLGVTEQKGLRAL